MCFVPRKNKIKEWVRLYLRVQQPNETMDIFTTVLYAKAEKCKYGPLYHELIEDRIVVGLRDTSLTVIMQLDTDLTLEMQGIMEYVGWTLMQ